MYISDLDLSTRVINTLLRAGINTLKKGNLAELNPLELMGMQKSYAKHIAEIVNAAFMVTIKTAI